MAMNSGRHSISTNLQNEMSEPESNQAFAGHGGFAQAPGYYNVRFIVRDNLSGKIGSVTAPLVVK